MLQNCCSVCNVRIFYVCFPLVAEVAGGLLFTQAYLYICPLSARGFCLLQIATCVGICAQRVIALVLTDQYGGGSLGRLKIKFCTSFLILNCVVHLLRRRPVTIGFIFSMGAHSALLSLVYVVICALSGHFFKNSSLSSTSYDTPPVVDSQRSKSNEESTPAASVQVRESPPCSKERDKNGSVDEPSEHPYSSNPPLPSTCYDTPPVVDSQRSKSNEESTPAASVQVRESPPCKESCEKSGRKKKYKKSPLAVFCEFFSSSRGMEIANNAFDTGTEVLCEVVSMLAGSLGS